MKKISILILVILIAIGSFWFLSKKNISQPATKSDSYWTCPMHPQIHLNHPGKCPICGMELIKVKSQESVIEQDKNMVQEMENKPYWTCPMHPEVHLDHPGECPICHMKLVLEKSPKPQKMIDEKRSEIMANDEQLKLAGVQKQQVEKMTLRVSIPISGRFIASTKVAFQIYESDLRYVKNGLSFSGESSFFPEKKLEGTIISIDSIVDPTSRTVRAVGVVKNAPGNIASETGFRGEIKFNLENRVAIPESAVLHTGNGDLVYVFSDNMLTPKNVELGLKAEGFYDVLDGLEPGQNISIGANFLIDSEAKIRGTSMNQMQMP